MLAYTSRNRWHAHHTCPAFGCHAGTAKMLLWSVESQLHCRVFHDHPWVLGVTGRQVLRTTCCCVYVCTRSGAMLWPDDRVHIAAAHVSSLCRPPRSGATYFLLDPVVAYLYDGLDTRRLPSAVNGAD